MSRTVRKQFGIPAAVASQHRWTRRGAVCGMSEFYDFSNNVTSDRAGLFLGGESLKQESFTNPSLSDCIENKD